jgi:phosphoribosylaminoimidazole (AIR) synthetase
MLVVLNVERPWPAWGWAAHRPGHDTGGNRQNDVAAAAVAPRWLLLLVLVPRLEDEELLGQIMHDASRAAQEVGASIIGGHTGYSAGV